MEFFIYVLNYARGWLEFHFMIHALPEALVFKIKLVYFVVALVWDRLSMEPPTPPNQNTLRACPRLGVAL